MMAPLTRSRTGEEGVQKAIGIEYYAQRATPGGLIIAEATKTFCPQLVGLRAHPAFSLPSKLTLGAMSQTLCTTKVAKCFCSCGTRDDPLNQPDGILPVSSSGKMENIRAGKKIRTREGLKEPVPARTLEANEIPEIVTENAIAAGFDGVELHGANGYLLEQFLHDGINDRTDPYGGSVEAILESLDSSKVGIRLSPFGASFGDKDSDPIATYTYVLDKLNDYDLAYAHLIEPRGYHVRNPLAPEKGSARQFRDTYKGVLITASGCDKQSAVQIVEEGAADAVERNFISNPDLVRRFQLNKPVNDYDADTFYLGNEKGYTDYPFLTKVSAQVEVHFIPFYKSSLIG